MKQHGMETVNNMIYLKGIYYTVVVATLLLIKILQSLYSLKELITVRIPPTIYFLSSLYLGPYFPTANWNMDKNTYQLCYNKKTATLHSF